MIELVLIVFLISMAAIATMAVKVGIKAVDFIEDTRVFFREIKGRQDEIIRLLKDKKSHSSGEKE